MVYLWHWILVSVFDFFFFFLEFLGLIFFSLI